MELATQPRSQGGGASQEYYGIDGAARRHVARKPVPVHAPDEPQLQNQLEASSDEYDQDALGYLASRVKRLDLEGEAPALPPRPRPAFIETTTLPLYSDLSPTDGDKSITPLSYASIASPSLAAKPVLSPATSFSTAATYTQKAYREVRHFAGGLIHHPSQSTKHYSILRHSHGIVFYQGPTSTTLTLSIFADQPLPPDRTLWVQSKGWSGNMGMRTGAALAGWSSTSRWIDVTPTTCVTVEDLRPSDERAWQRDIMRFAKRTARDKRARHQLRETAIVQIPVEARDGYYRVVLCTGGGRDGTAPNKKRKVLCPSPIFRVLSTSTSPGSVRGASLVTLPLEVGAMMLSSAAKTAAKTATGNAIAPVAAVAQQQIQPYKPSWAMQTAAKAAYNVSGVSKRVDFNVQNANQLYEQKRSEEFRGVMGGNLPDDAPRAPFPIEFVGFVDYTSGIAEDFDIPTIFLTEIPEDISKSLNGYYFGWVNSYSRGKNEREPGTEYDEYWQKAIISVVPDDLLTSSSATITEKGLHSIAIYLIQDEVEASLLQTQVQVQVMDFIRLPDQLTGQRQDSEKASDIQEADAEDALIAAINDIEIANAFLDRPAWAPRSSALQKDSSKLKPLQRVTKSYTDTRMSLQKQIDRVPFHLAGIRMPSNTCREQESGNGGMYIIR